MAFKDGDAKPEKSGRKKGTPNKRTFDAIELAQRHDCDPLEILLMIAKGDWQGLDLPSKEVIIKGVKYSRITLDDRRSAAKDATPFIYPKRKPVDKDGDDSDALTDLLKAINGQSGPT